MKKAITCLVLLVALLPLPSMAQGTVQQGPWDRWENNYDPAHAAQLVAGEPIAGLNFVCPQRPFEQLPPNCTDTDWFWVALRGGACYTAETRDLAAGVDTNVILFGEQADKAPPLAGNDNATAGELRSAATVCLPAEPVQQRLYLLIGQVGDLPPPPPVAERTYTLVVSALKPTPVPAPPAPPTATPEPLVANDGPTGQAVVVAPSAALRTTPDGPVVQTMRQGERVQLLGTVQRTWVRVQPSNAVVPGWIEAAQLRRVSASPSPAPDSAVPSAPTPTAPVPTATLTPTVQASPTNPPTAVPSVPTEEALPVEELPALPLPPPSVPALRSLDLTVEVRGSGASRTTQPPLPGVRVQLVDAFGEVLAEAVTDAAGRVRWTRALDPALALWVQLPSAGVRAQLDAAEVAAGTATIRVVLPSVAP